MASLGITAFYVSGTEFTIPADMTAEFCVYRRVKANCGDDGYAYGCVSTSTYSSDTGKTTVTLSDSVLTANLSTVWFGVVAGGDSGALPDDYILSLFSVVGIDGDGNDRGANAICLQTGRTDVANVASGEKSIALGYDTKSEGNDCIAIGSGASTGNAPYGMAIGKGATASTYKSTAIVEGATASGTSCLAIGLNATAAGSNTTAIGPGASSSSSNNISIGKNASISGDKSLSIGYSTTNDGVSSIAIGYKASCDSLATNGISIGKECANKGCDAIVIGNSASTSSSLAVNAVVIGTEATSSGNSAMSIGEGATTSGTKAIAIGKNSNSTATYSTAIGSGAEASYSNAIAIGDDSESSGHASLAIGSRSSAAGHASVAIGCRANAKDTKNSSFGGYAYSNNSSMAAGFHSFASGAYSQSIGYRAKSLVPSSSCMSGGIITRNTDNASGKSEFLDYTSAEITFMSDVVDLTTSALTTIVLPTGGTFYPNEVGLIITEADTVTVQPMLQFGSDETNLETLIAATATTDLSAVRDRERFTTLLTDNGMTASVTAKNSVAATATTMTGRFYWKGMWVEDEAVA